MFLGVGKQDHDNQNRYDTSGCEILHHGCHTTGLAHYVACDRAVKDDEHHRRGRQCAALQAPGISLELGDQPDHRLTKPSMGWIMIVGSMPEQ
jgi:hypothetical protein